VTEPTHEFHPIQDLDPTRKRRLTYLVAGVITLILVAVGLVLFRHAEHTESASENADQLIAALEQAGLTAPTKDQAVRTLGEDGGAVCADPGDALKLAIRNQLGSSGAAGPGQRPGPMAEHTIQGELLVLEIYCPDELPAFLKYVDGLDLHDLRRD
jgi:hypothetical protein